jgi:selenocysteine lyase/cysteine desulfurase
LTATVDYLASLGSLVGGETNRRARLRAAFGATSAWETRLAERLIAGLREIDGVGIVGIANAAGLPDRVPTVSFTHAAVRSSSIAEGMAKRGVFVWSGHNFALETVRSLGIDEEEGVVRIGAAHYNTIEEIDEALDALKGVLSA